MKQSKALLGNLSYLSCGFVLSSSAVLAPKNFHLYKQQSTLARILFQPITDPYIQEYLVL